MASTSASVPASNARARAAKLERAGDLAGALSEYQSALAFAPDDPDLLAAVAHLAQRLEMHEVAVQLWAKVGRLAPERLEAVDGQARALRELGRFDEAVSVLRETLMAHPGEARLWNSLGVALVQRGETETAITFFDEALRLDPRLATALYNRGGARFDLGRLEAAAADFIAARKHARKASDVAMIDFAAATLALARGEIAAGWEAYESRFAAHWTGAVSFDAPGRRWNPRVPLAGKRLLVLGEQGVGDEVMFASMLPDVIEDLGPEGRLSLAVDPRLVPLFQRSFPEAEVSAHATSSVGGRPLRSAPQLSDPRSVDLWTPVASLARTRRTSLDAFPREGGYLIADPARVAHWRAWLGAGPPAIGFSWRSGKVAGERRRHYPALDAWAPLLEIPGVRFVNLQYGDCADELKALSGLAGREILQPPGIDLREDLDDLAALGCALDLAVCVPNATAQLIGACGRPLILVSAPAAWPQLGGEAYPWHPHAIVAAASKFGDWGAPIAKVADLVRENVAR